MADGFTPRVTSLLRRFGGNLPDSVITDHDKTTVIRWHRLRRKGRADDRERLRRNRKTQQDAESEAFHISIFMCIIRAIEIVNSLADHILRSHRSRARR